MSTSEHGLDLTQHDFVADRAKPVLMAPAQLIGRSGASARERARPKPTFTTLQLSVTHTLKLLERIRETPKSITYQSGEEGPFPYTIRVYRKSSTDAPGINPRLKKALGKSANEGTFGRGYWVFAGSDVERGGDVATEVDWRCCVWPGGISYHFSGPRLAPAETTQLTRGDLYRYLFFVARPTARQALLEAWLADDPLRALEAVGRGAVTLDVGTIPQVEFDIELDGKQLKEQLTQLLGHDDREVRKRALTAAAQHSDKSSPGDLPGGRSR